MHRAVKHYMIIHNITLSNIGHDDDIEGSLDFLLEQDFRNYDEGKSTPLGKIRISMMNLERIIPDFLIMVGYDPMRGEVKTRREAPELKIPYPQIRYNRIDPFFSESNNWYGPVLSLGPITMDKSKALVEKMAQEGLKILYFNNFNT